MNQPSTSNLHPSWANESSSESQLHSASASDRPLAAVRPQILSELSQQIRQLETLNRPSGRAISTGCQALDRCLPLGGYQAGSLVEIVRRDTGMGATSLAMAMARNALLEGKYLVLIDPQQRWNPVAVQAWGIALERTIVLHPRTHEDVVWGLDQSLRCPAIGAVIASQQRMDDRLARRLQLAAEQGGGVGFLIRETRTALREPSWADIRWLLRSVSSVPDASKTLALSHARRFELELLRCTGGRAGTKIQIGIGNEGQWIDESAMKRGNHEQTSALHLATELAKPARRRREIAG